jgi:secretion/DNA translocation related TadE-like protein
MMAVMLAATVGAVEVGSAVIARHHAQAAADMAALAAAGSMAAGASSACQKAAAVAVAMRTAVTGCRTETLDIVVTVEAQVPWARWGVGPARAVARAGPESTS